MLSTRKYKSSPIAYVALVTGILSIGMSPLLIRWADASGVVSSLYRMAFGSIFLSWLFLYRILKKRTKLPKKGILFAVAGGFFFSVDLAFWSTGVVLSGAAIPTLLGNTAPLWVGLGSWIVFREDHPKKFWIGLITALLGAGLVLSIDMEKSPEFGLGSLFGALAALFYGAFYLASQRGREHLDTINYFWISTSTSAIFLFLYTILLGEPLVGYNQKTWILFFLMGLIVQVLGWLFITFTQGHLPAALVSPTMLGQPVIVAILAWLLLHERFSIGQVIGGSMVILGIFLVHYGNGNTLQESKKRMIVG